jgi:hypothetical protein
MLGRGRSHDIIHHHHVFVFNNRGVFDHYLDGAFFHDHKPEHHYDRSQYVEHHKLANLDYDSPFDIDDSACDDDCRWREHDDDRVEYFSDAAVHGS